MNLEKLARKLKRELAANPKRAALLGLMLIVAVYYWAPLASKWLGTGGRKDNRTGGLVILGDDLPIAERAKTKSQPRWDKILAWMEADPRMYSSTKPVHAHPFVRTNSVKAEITDQAIEEPAASSAPVALDVTPQSVGAVLNGLLIGTKQKQATINGETYRVGESIVLGNEEGSGRLQFELLQVDKDGVLLSRGRKVYELKLERTKLAGRDKIERAAE